MEKAPISPTTKRLLGLRDFEASSPELVKELLQSDNRAAAWESIETTTLPQRPKREMKKGVVLEAIKQNLLSREILKKYPLVYIGSGTDVEYPLSLGGRNILLVDPAFEDERMVEDVMARVRKLVGERINTDSQNTKITFPFDFGEGEEDVTVELVSKPYVEGESEGCALPDEVGVVVLFASQGPGGSVRIDENMKSKLVARGAILEEADFTRITAAGEEETIELGT